MGFVWLIGWIKGMQFLKKEKNFRFENIITNRKNWHYSIFVNIFFLNSNKELTADQFFYKNDTKTNFSIKKKK